MRETVRCGISIEGTIQKGVVSMIRKLTAIIAAALALTCAAASAEELLIEKENWTGSSVIISDYDKSGKLSSSRMYTAENGMFKIPSEELNESSRLWFTGSDKVVTASDLTFVTPAPEPQATQTPQPTSAPTSAPGSSYPSIYGKEINAVNAFSVVKDVVSALDDNGEEVYDAVLLFQGKEIKAQLPADLAITSSSEEFSYMDGKNAGALKTGDVIFTRKSLTGKYAVLSLIFRPLDEDIISSGTDYGANFEKLISAGGKTAGNWNTQSFSSNTPTGGTVYAFGVVYDKMPGELTLLGPDGDTNKAVYIGLQNDSIVYEFDASARTNPLSISRISSIRKLPGAKPDENGIIDYGKSLNYSYALVRAIDGTATDIIVFTNYR